MQSDTRSPSTTGVSWIWVYDALQAAIAVRHYSKKTWHTYPAWVRKLPSFTQSKDPQPLSMTDVERFLSHLAVDKKVATSTQNQAFNALLFLFKHILQKEFEIGAGVLRAKRKPTISVVLSRPEVDQVIPKRATAHTLRYSFASHLLQANYDIRTIQELLGHSSVKTTMIYTHTVPSRTLKEAVSPLDF